MRIYTERIFEMLDKNDNLKMELSKTKKINSENRNDLIDDIKTFLTTNQMINIIDRISDFEISIDVKSSINTIRELENKFIISKSANILSFKIFTDCMGYPVFKYDLDKKSFIIKNNVNCTTKMPNFLFAKIFFEELELILQSQNKRYRINCIYGKNMYWHMWYNIV